MFGAEKSWSNGAAELHISVDLLCGTTAAELHNSVDLRCDTTAVELHNSVNLLCGTTAAELNPAPGVADIFLACESIRFSSLFAAGNAKHPQRRRARRNGCFRRLTFSKDSDEPSKVKFNSKLLKDERFVRFSKHRSMCALRIRRFSKLFKR